MGEEYTNILFEGLTVRNAKILNTIFKNVHFKNCYLGFDSIYSSCMFENCKFFGKYSSLGRPSKYLNCKFVNCLFIGLNLFEGQTFIECSFSGKIKNAILRDEHPNIKNAQTIFDKCNLSETIFDCVNIYGNSIFRNTYLPKKGIRLYKNQGDSLLKRAINFCSKIKDDSKIESEVIFRESKRGQDPIILDEIFLSTFFKTNESKEIFDEIVKGFEINE